jgi:predicted anti-sigma-YlaC factor YlaD
MTKRVFAVAAVGIAAVLVAGGLVASNMGFKANYHLDTIGSNGSVTGAQTLALPYNQQTGINTAQDLINDINTDAGAAVVDNVSRIVRTTDLKESYSLSVGGTNFPLVPGEAYVIVVLNDVTGWIPSHF